MKFFDFLSSLLSNSQGCSVKFFSFYSLGCPVKLSSSYLFTVSLLTGVLSEVLPLQEGCYSLGCSAK